MIDEPSEHVDGPVLFQVHSSIVHASTTTTTTTTTTKTKNARHGLSLDGHHDGRTQQHGHAQLSPRGGRPARRSLAQPQQDT